jgi:hypothetical protein
MAVFWVVVPCRLVEVYHRFRGPCCLHHQGDHPDDGGSKDLWNVVKLLPDYTVLQPRRQPSSYSPPWEPQILQNTVLYLLICLTNKMSAVCVVLKIITHQKNCLKMCGSKYLIKSTMQYWSNEDCWFHFLVVSTTWCKFGIRQQNYHSCTIHRLIAKKIMV